MLKDSYHVALIGSSGGGSATISSGIDIIGCIQRNLASITRGCEIAGTSKSPLISITEIAFIQCQYGMDFVNPLEVNSATLMIAACGGSLEKKCSGTLNDVNNQLEIEDRRIADLILLGSVDAIVSISSDPEGANKLTVAAAILKNIPFLGTGGTSLSFISTSGGNVIGSSGGSVATSAVTRGICIAASLAAYKPWGKMKYSIPTTPKLAKFRSVVGAALPVLLSVSLLKASLPVCGRAITLITSYSQLLFDSERFKLISKIPFIGELIVSLNSLLLLLFEYPNKAGVSYGSMLERSYHLWYANLLDSLEHKVIPVVISSLSCLEVCNLEELSLLSGAAAGAFVSGNILCAYLAGSICGFLLPLLLIRCAQNSLLPTSTAILSVGVSAMLSGVTASIFCGPLILIMDLGPRFLYEIVCAVSMLLFGSVCDGFTTLGCILGWAVSWGSEQGYYHVIMLPLIALGMEGGMFSVLGTYDSFCLCVPCAGVCFAIYISSAYHLSRQHSTSALNPVDTSENISKCSGVQNDIKSSNNGRDAHINASIADVQKDEVVQSAVGTEGPSESCSLMSNSSQTVSPGTDKESCLTAIGGYDHHLRQGMKGTISNLLMGDYVEACYPYTLHNRWVLLSVRVSSAIAGGLILGYLGFQVDRFRLMLPPSCLAGHTGATADYQFRSSAYLPLPLTIMLAIMMARKEYIPSDTCPNLAVDEFIASESAVLPGGITSKLFLLTRIRALSGPMVIVIIVMVSFFLPFLMTLIIYSSKIKLRKRN